MLSSEVTTGSPEIIQAMRKYPQITPSIESTDVDDEEPCTENLEASLSNSEKHIMANDILNDILETAMTIAEGGERNKKNKMNIIDDEEPTNCNELKTIIDSLDKIGMDQVNKTPPLEVDVKRILSEMMHVNESKNLGLGDSPPIDIEYPPTVFMKPSKAVEKKTRVTDLVMNSTKVLTHILNEEQRRKQDEWEEANEHVIQIIELEQGLPIMNPLYPETFPLPYDEDDNDLLLMPQDPSQLESIDLATEDAAAGNSVGGKGDEKKARDSKSSTLNKIGHLWSASTKKRRWFTGFKFCNFRKHRKQDKDNNKQENNEDNNDEHIEGATSAICE